MTCNEASLSNEQLVQRLQQGEDYLFTLLVERMTPLLQDEVSRVRCNQADGDDLVQEALLALLSAAEHYTEGKASFTTFARTCVRNRLLSALRRLSFRETLREDEQLYEELDRRASESDPGNQLIDREKELALIQKLKTVLSDLEYRVLMYHLAAFSYERIAASLGITVKSVDNALQRIRRKLAIVL